jgi:hypothetical protein
MRIVIWRVLWALVIFLAPLSADAALPQKSNIAVVAGGDGTSLQMASVEALLIQELLMSGYRPVDEKKMTQIRREKARFFAAEDNVAAIRKLSSQYGIGTVITARIRVSQQRDALAGYDGRTSIVLMATSSGGKRLYGGTFFSRKPGYTPEEAAQKSIESAVREAVYNMLR